MPSLVEDDYDSTEVSQNHLFEKAWLEKGVAYLHDGHQGNAGTMVRSRLLGRPNNQSGGGHNAVREIPSGSIEDDANGPQPMEDCRKGSCFSVGGSASLDPPRRPHASCLVENDIAKQLVAWMNEEVVQHLMVMNRKLDLLCVQARRNMARNPGSRRKSLFESCELGRPSIRHSNARNTTGGQQSGSLADPYEQVPIYNSSYSNYSRHTNSGQPSALTQIPPLPESDEAVMVHMESVAEDSGSGVNHTQVPMHTQLNRQGSESPGLSHELESPKRLGQRTDALSFVCIADKISYLRYRRGPKAVKIWRFLENPYSSTLAQVYACMIPVLVVASVFVSFWQTVPGCPLIGTGGELLQMFFEAVFGIEFIVRLIVCPDRWHFCFNIFNYIDLFSASPLLIRLVYAVISLSGTHHSAEAVLSNLAVVPVLRLLKLTRRFEKFQLLFDAFLLVVEALPVLLYTLTVIALIFAALVHLAEPAESIPNLPKALWFVIVTMTTVGYGDTMVVTTPGYCAVTVLMIISGMYMAMPIGIVGSAFSQVWNDRDRLLLMQRIRVAFLQEGFSADAMEDIVQMFDEDKDGLLDLQEFRMMLEAMHIHIGDSRVYMLLDSLDTNNDGTINIQELMDGLFPRSSYGLGSIMATLARSPSKLKEVRA